MLDELGVTNELVGRGPQMSGRMAHTLQVGADLTFSDWHTDPFLRSILVVYFIEWSNRGAAALAAVTRASPPPRHRPPQACLRSSGPPVLPGGSPLREFRIREPQWL